MTENTVIPLIILAITFPTVTILPLQIALWRTLNDIDKRLTRLEAKHDTP